ncbi:VCBS repeat-containing protein [Pendulispora brunnea]|uniref:VCBS repeat-containing protein n=1 Tax=Pendulispora brunnea TaxID=2905690 RepID=A0ABZ2JUW9_9BACT
MKFRRFGGVLVAGLAGMFSCRALPDTGECGNDVAEAGEDCDGTLPGTVCKECRFRCTAPDSTTSERIDCPIGYFCAPKADRTWPGGPRDDKQHRCRAPSGNFEVIPLQAASKAFLDVADVDGDGVKEVIATSSSLTQAYSWNPRRFNPTDAAFSKVFIKIPNWSSDRDYVRPVVTPWLGPGGDALLFSAGRLAVWLPDARSHTLEPVQYPTVVFEHAEGLRVVAADTHLTIDGEASPGAELYLFRPSSDGLGPHIARLQAHVPKLIHLLREPPARLAGEVQIADLSGDKLADMAFAFKGSTVVDVFLPAQPPSDMTVALPSGYVVGGKGILLEDLDGDGKRDILVHVEGGASKSPIAVAYGLGNGTFDSSPNPSPTGHGDGHASIWNPDPSVQLGSSFPLAAGQLTNVGPSDERLCDFVFPDGILFRFSEKERYVKQPSPPHVRWEEAKIDDFNGDGFPDIVTRSKGALMFHQGSKEPMVMMRANHTVSDVTGFVVGDFDGDSQPDAACSISDATHSELRVVYNVSSPDEARTEKEDVSVPMGQFPPIERMVSGHLGSDGLADIAIVGKSSEADSRYLALLQGSAAKEMVSPLELDHLRGKNESFESLAVAVGRFADDGRLGIAALVESAEDRPAHGLWRLPLAGDAQVILGGSTYEAFPKDPLRPLAWKKASIAALDLDPKSDVPLDELLIAVPPAESKDPKGALVVARLVEGKWAIESSRPLGDALESRIPWKVQAVDIDGDQAKDLAVLFEEGKEEDGRTRVKLDVYFNDQTGTLGNPVSIAMPGYDMVDCAWLHADPHSAAKDKKDLVVLVRESSDPNGEAHVFVLTTDATKRSFSAPRALQAKESALALRPGAAVSSSRFRGSITAGDIDGDGVDDIVYSTGREATLLKGTPTTSDPPRGRR